MGKVKGKLALSSSKSHREPVVVPRSQSSLDASQFDVACHFTHHMRIHDETVLPPRSQSCFLSAAFLHLSCRCIFGADLEGNNSRSPQTKRTSFMIRPLLGVPPQKWILTQLKMFSPRRVSEKEHVPAVYEDRAKYSGEIVCQECRLPEESTISVSRLPVLEPSSFVLGQGGKLRDLLE